MPTRRQARINGLLLEELSMLVPGRTTDPRLMDVTITRVESTQDLGTAKVYYTLSPDMDETEQAASANALSHAEGHLRQELAGLGLRRIPRLVLARDKGYESSQRVLEILGKLGSEAQGVETAAEADDRGSGADSGSTDAETGGSER